MGVLDNLVAKHGAGETESADTGGGILDRLAKKHSLDAANEKAAKGESVFGGKKKPTDTRKVSYTDSGYRPNQPAKSGKEFARNLVQDVVEAPLMPVRMLADVANSPDTPSTLAELGKGLVRGPLEFVPGVGEALGGRSATEAWSTNPGYGAMTLAGVGAAGKAMRGAGKGAGNTLAELKPSGGGLADKTATKLYDMTLKQGTTLKPEIRRQNVREGLEGGYLPNNKGVDKLAADVRATETRVGEGIKAGAEAGVRGNLGRAIANVEALREQAMRSDNPAKNLALIDAEIEQLQAHPILDQTGTVPIDQLQKMKVEQGRHVKYQEKNGQAVDPFKASIDKARIRGFKEELEVQLADVFPELKDQNAQLSRKYKLQDVLERAANRIENNQGIGIGLPIKGGAGATIGGMMGGPAGAAIGGGIGTLIGIIEHPAVAPRLAIALHRASKGKLTMAQARASANERLDYIKNKMKDERGLVGKNIDVQPLELYRGDSVNPDGLGKGSIGDLGRGHYFTDASHSAEYFTDGTDKSHVRKFDVPIKKPFDLMNRNIHKTTEWKEMVATLPEDPKYGVKNRENLDMWAKGKLDVRNPYDFLARSFGQTPETFNDFLAKFGFDSVKDQGVRGIAEGGEQYVVFDKSKVKLRR